MSDPLLLTLPFIGSTLISCGILVYVIRVKRKVEAKIKWLDDMHSFHSHAECRFEERVNSALKELQEDLAKRRSAAAKELSEKARQKREAQRLANAIINPS